MSDKIEVLKGRIEEIEIPEKVDVIVSEVTLRDNSPY